MIYCQALFTSFKINIVGNWPDVTVLVAVILRRKFVVYCAILEIVTCFATAGLIQLGRRKREPFGHLLYNARVAPKHVVF